MTQAPAWVFLCPAAALVFAAVFILDREMLLAETRSSNSSVLEELSGEEKRSMVEELLAEGDRFRDAKSYNLANAAYESVFQLDPENGEASERIDELKRVMTAEGKTETELVGGVYGEEIKFRVERYWNEADQFVQQGKRGQARLALQKLLLLDPLHKRGRALYEQVQPQSEEVRS